MSHVLREAFLKDCHKKFRVTDLQIHLIQRLHREGNSPTSIARSAKCSRRTVYKWITRKGTVRVKQPGRPAKVVTPVVVAAVGAVARERAHMPTTNAQLAALAGKKAGVFLDRNATRRAKRQLGIKGKKGRAKPANAFRRTTRDKRLAITQERIKWTPASYYQRLQQVIARDGLPTDF